MTTIHTASHQWAARPADERFVSLTSLNQHCLEMRQRSVGKAVASRLISCAPVESDSRELMCVGPNGGPVSLTHWSFGQLAQRAGAPAGYLRSLPAPLAADNINFGLQTRDVEDLGVLLCKNVNAPSELRAVTGPNYGRIWNSTITQALINRFGDGVTGDFRVPGEFGQAVEVTKANTTLYASDRDMFVFLADETNRIVVPGRRAGKSGSMARGFFVWNSEVGSTTLGIATFLFDYVCGNRIVWGADKYAEIRIRHTTGAPTRWIDEVIPAIENYAHSSTESITQAIEKAKAARITSAYDDVDAFLKTRFSKSQVSAIKAAHLSDEDRPIETLWDATTAVTAYARSVQYQDERVALEREGGRILQLAQ